MSKLLEARGLTKTYLDGAQARSVLSEVSFALDPGAVLAVMGPSGSGKSTLLNVLAGMLEADAGSLLLHLDDGPRDLCDLSEGQRTRLRRRHIGYVFQFFNLVPTLTVRENVLLPLELNGLQSLAPQALARLESLGLAERADDFPEHLSGGERQRTAIARALAHAPALVLADEPTGNLDADNVQRVADMLISHARQAGSALVLATHDEAVAARADSILRLRA